MPANSKVSAAGQSPSTALTDSVHAAPRLTAGGWSVLAQLVGIMTLSDVIRAQARVLESPASEVPARCTTERRVNRSATTPAVQHCLPAR